MDLGHGPGNDRRMDLPPISVVIPTHGRPELLRRCLYAVVGQTYPLDRMEIVVVEDGGPGEAEHVVCELRRQRPDARIAYLAVEHGGPGAARNAGLRRAGGEVIAFTDDDTIRTAGTSSRVRRHTPTRPAGARWCRTATMPGP